MEEKKKFSFGTFVIVSVIVIVAGVFAAYYFMNESFKNAKMQNMAESTTTTTTTTQTTTSVPAEEKKVAAKSEYALTDNNFSKFDLSFLKFENEKENKIYSPLSIKYAFKMLADGTTGEAREQLGAIVDGYELTEYKSNENMALANSFWIRDTYQENVKDSYINLIKRNYEAEVNFDDFSNANNVNEWVSDNTLGLIDELFTDEDVQEMQFALVNSLGIDMEWNNKFLDYYEKETRENDKNITGVVEYRHAKEQNSESGEFRWEAMSSLYEMNFDEDQKVSSMEVYASLNNYDVVKDIGAEKIREIVYADFKDWALSQGKYEDGGSKYSINEDDYEKYTGENGQENIDKDFEEWFDNSKNFEHKDGEIIELEPGYIAALNLNKDRVDYTTDFMIYDDENIKAFAKDLKTYDGVTLQYVGIMPKKVDLDKYVESIDQNDVKSIINKLKELKLENFDEGYLTYIHGNIPKFNFDYDLDLQEDLEKLGVKDIFEQGKANLTELTSDESIFIGDVRHSANIEFSEDGIKAGAATGAGGSGGGSWYDYYFEMPTKEIDITFDKPFMFLVRDKNTGETWFTGTVYEPLKSEDEQGPITYLR